MDILPFGLRCGYLRLPVTVTRYVARLLRLVTFATVALRVCAPFVCVYVHVAVLHVVDSRLLPATRYGCRLFGATVVTFYTFTHCGCILRIYVTLRYPLRVDLLVDYGLIGRYV